MKKTVTALMVLLPLIFLIALFAITSATSVVANIPASGIVINNKGDNGIFSLDIANYNNPVYESDLEVEVLPYKAKNRKYSLAITDANTGEPTDIVTKNDDGAFELNDVGTAKLTYTSDDGGYSDSIIFNVGSSGVIDYVPTLTDLSGATEYPLSKGITTDYTVTITTGDYLLGGDYYPSTATNVQPKYTAIDNNAIKLNEVSGKLSAYFETTTAVEMSLVNAFGETAKKTIELKIQKSVGVTVNGKTATTSYDNAPMIFAPLFSKSFTVYADLNTTDVITLSTGIYSAQTQVRKLDVGDGAYAIDVVLDEAVTSETTSTWSINFGGKQYFFDVKFANYDFSVNSFGNRDGKGDLVILEGATIAFTISCEPDANLVYTWHIENENIAKLDSSSSSNATITALGTGTTNLVITWEKKDDSGVSGRIARTIIVTKAYTSLIFNESVSSYGLGNLAIANERYDENGNIQAFNYSTSLFNNVLNGQSAQERVTSYDDIELWSSDDKVAKAEVCDDGVKFIVKNDGTITIYAKWKYADRFNVKETSFTFTAVNGVYVKNYAELKDAGSKDKQIVLENDVYLGENLFDSNGKALYNDDVMKAKLLGYTDEITTTFDSQYYKNLYGDDYLAKVRYCYEFTNNVYGNGYMLNTEYISHMFDSTGQLRDYAVFRGPLNFVAAKMSGTDVASVKGQDNMSFLIRKAGITLDNVVLAGCNDETLYDGDNIELNLLNYTGTTLEVMNDATIKNCRIKNGRTVLRVHGKYGVNQNGSVNVTEEKIYVVIDGCRLQTAREFILKVGTNRVKRGSIDGEISPSFYNGNGVEYTAYNSSACDNYKDDEYFVNNFVLTDVTLKDTTLSTSGLFSVGMESHFSGGMLDGGTTFNLEGWKNLAGTSYPAILHLVGNVVFDDWKDLNNVDSSTLIETNLSTSQSNLSFLSLNICEMLKSVKSLNGFDNIIYKTGDKEYVHGGIAFYGGGKNYSILDASECDTFKDMNQYNVNISILVSSADEVLRKQGEMLPLAAGSYDFRFVMHDGTSNYKPKG